MNCKNSLHLLSIPQHRYTESNPRYPDPPGEPNALTRNAKRLRARETSTLPNLQNKTALRWRLPGPVSKARASLAEPASVGRLHTQLSSTPWEKMRRAAQPDTAVTPESKPLRKAVSKHQALCITSRILRPLSVSQATFLVPIFFTPFPFYLS